MLGKMSCLACLDRLPIEPSALAPFLLAVLLIELTPGPNMGYLAALSASQGRAAGFKAVLGVTLGLAFYMLLAVLGVAEIIAAAPFVYGALRWAGVAYLLYLAWEAWRGASETSPDHSGETDHAPFWRGLLANVLNPKALVFGLVLLPPAGTEAFPLRLGIFCLLVAVVALLWGGSGALTRMTGATAGGRLLILQRCAASWLAIVAFTLLGGGIAA